MTDLDHGADLRERFDRATADLLTPDGLADAVLADGRRLRRRRRGLTLAGGGVAAAAVAAIVLANLGGGPATTGQDVADQSTPSPTPPRTATATSGLPSPGADNLGAPGSERPEGWWDVPSTDLVDVLEGLLPSGVSVVEAETRIETGDPDDPWAPGTGGLHGVLEGPSGPGTFQVILYPPDASTSDELVREPGAATLRSRITCRAYHEGCQPITDADGVQVGRVATDTERGTAYYDAVLLGPDGGAVYLAVMNSSGEKPGYEPPSADVPPLTVDQLRELVQDPAWTSYTP